MNGKQLLSNLKFNESYSKFIKELNRKETWEESCDDVMSMHYNKFSKLNNWEEIKPYYDLALDSYRSMEILASQRNLQFREEHITKHNERLYNCSSTYIDRIEVFKQIFFILLCGCGVGYSVEKRFIDKLPLLKKRNENEYFVHVVEDSIEGWSNSLHLLLNSYFNASVKIMFDYSKIRPKNALIAGEFLAPGHEGLEKSLNLIDKLLQEKVNNNDFKLTSLNCHDIICLTSDSVLSGGVRRSALICLFDKDDDLMLKCKTGDWWVKTPWRARANNSIKLLKSELTKKEFDEYKETIKQYGEPGIALVDNLDFNTNPLTYKEFFASLQY